MRGTMIRTDSYLSNTNYYDNRIAKRREADKAKSNAEPENKGVLLEISGEGRNIQEAAKQQETEEPHKSSEEKATVEEAFLEKEEVSIDKLLAQQEGSKQSGKISVNAAKRARQIASAKTDEQLRAVLALLRNDLQQCQAGLKSGMCDQTEVDKVKALIVQANQRLAQVKDREATPEEEAAFHLASLM